MPNVRLDDTLEMHYYDDNYSDPWRTPETVVLHHGNAKSGRFFYSWVPLLSGNYRVIRLDMRGFGQSDEPPPGYQYSIGNLAEDLKNFLDALGLERVHLVGETLGGGISYWFACHYPERLKSLTVSSGPFKFGPAFKEVLEKGNRIGLEELYRSTNHWRFDPNEGDPEQAEWFAKEVGKTPMRSWTELQSTLAGNDLSEMISKLRVPTLMLAPEKRDPSWPHKMEDAAQLIPNCKLVYLPGTWGYVPYTSPELSVQAWKEFVANLP